MKMIIQVFRPAVERACENEKPFSRNRKPKKVATNQKIKCSVPIQTSEFVHFETHPPPPPNPTTRLIITINTPQPKPPNFRKLGRAASQTGKNVQARKANQRREKQAAGNFYRRGPELYSLGKRAGYHTVNQAAKDTDKYHRCD